MGVQLGRAQLLLGEHGPGREDREEARHSCRTLKGTDYKEGGSGIDFELGLGQLRNSAPNPPIEQGASRCRSNCTEDPVNFLLLFQLQVRYRQGSNAAGRSTASGCKDAVEELCKWWSKV